MSDDLDRELQVFEERLRAAHASLVPRPGLKDELRPGPRASGFVLPWQGVAAAAAVLLAVGGVGFLLSRPAVSNGGGAGASTRYQLAPEQVAFGRLPRPRLTVPEPLSAGAGAASTAQLAPPANPPKSSADTVLPNAAPVYRWETSKARSTLCQGAPRTFDGYPLLGGGCADLGPTASAIYRLAPPPAGASLVYVEVADGQYGYVEPAYELPGGAVVTALTADELRP